MGPGKGWYSLTCALLILCAIGPGVSAWTVQSLVVKPSGEPVPPGTPVTISYTVHFDSRTTGGGETFDAGHSLDMVTGLDNAKWAATLVNINEDRAPITTQLDRKTGARCRIDGWTLSYGNAELNLVVTLQGTAPDVPSAQEITMIRVEELDSGAEEVPGASTLVQYQVGVPTAATTPRPAPASVPGDTTRTFVTTAPVATAPVIPAPAATGLATSPGVRQTYSYGPDPLLTAGLLAVAGVVARKARE